MSYSATADVFLKRILPGGACDEVRVNVPWTPWGALTIPSSVALESAVAGPRLLSVEVYGLRVVTGPVDASIHFKEPREVDDSVREITVDF